MSPSPTYPGISFGAFALYLLGMLLLLLGAFAIVTVWVPNLVAIPQAHAASQIELRTGSVLIAFFCLFQATLCFLFGSLCIAVRDIARNSFTRSGG